MFETAELGRKVSKKEFRERTPVVREALLRAQRQLRETAEFPVIVLFAGVDGAGKSETVNLLNAWMDPRWIVTRAFGPLSEEERERPEYWRFWRELPPEGRVGLFLSAWYSRPLLQRVHGLSKTREFEGQLKEILDFEKTLVDDGALILKFWMHLGKKDQKKRLKALAKDPLQSWRVTTKDWHNWRLYDRFVETAERIISRTSTGESSWFIVEGLDHPYRSLRVSECLLNAMQARLSRERANSNEEEDRGSLRGPAPGGDSVRTERVTILSQLEIPKALEGKTYKSQLSKHQGELNLLQRKAREKKVSTILVFEGSDAGGKGGAIRRITAALDARAVQIIPIAAPTDEERAQHYLWRFWRHLPRSGRVTIFDRSWYGRVLVERVEGFATDEEWRRAYAEINTFERQLIEHGVVLAKFWLHITKDEQLRRFRAREETPFKRWKITEEDWRNREKWDQYEDAVHDMVERTSTQIAPWTLVEGNDKKYARVKILKTVCDKLKRAIE